jgi:hypothetical protein
MHSNDTKKLSAYKAPYKSKMEYPIVLMTAYVTIPFLNFPFAFVYAVAIKNAFIPGTDKNI